jgi:serine/threonine-protein kinase
MYLIEQRIAGETLRSRLIRTRPLSLDVVVTLMQTLLDTAVEMEDRRLVHRDIKPPNIMVDQVGRFWLLDFGIARHLDKSSLTKGVRQFGLATFGYAAPEQLRNVRRDIDIRTDLFAIGVVAYECLSGINPFTDSARDLLEVVRRTEQDRPAPLHIPGDRQRQLSGFLATLMAKQPSLRPSSAREAADWFAALLPTLVIP